MSARMIWSCLPEGVDPDWKKFESLEVATCQREKEGNNIFWQRIKQLEAGKEVIHTIYGRYKRNFGGEVIALHDTETVKDCLRRVGIIIRKNKNLKFYNHLIY